MEKKFLDHYQEKINLDQACYKKSLNYVSSLSEEDTTKFFSKEETTRKDVAKIQNISIYKGLSDNYYH